MIRRIERRHRCGPLRGFKVLRYIDPQGHECAFYDTALLYPLNAVRLTGSSPGVAVVDMSDPSHPVQTDRLTALPMLSPHESLSLNPRRGLLAAVLGNPATAPGLVSMYDASHDCRHPVLDSTALVARFGHEGNFASEGNTFYAAGTSVKSVTAIDVSNPKDPHAIWQGSLSSHGLTLSDDGNRAYVADPVDGQLLILDTSQILLEFDEYAFRFGSAAPPDTVGAARVIDISDELHPRVVSNLRLAVDQPAAHHAASGDSGAQSSVQGYAAHYCSVPREVDPGIVACSFITSGLRIFDIHDPLHPREIAYYIAPASRAVENGLDGSNYAMLKPAFAPERREVWYSDGGRGFYVLRLEQSVWPDATGVPGAVGHPGGPAASGRLAGRRLGLVVLGEARARLRQSLRVYSTRNRRQMDFFCLRGGGIRAGYPSPAPLRSLRAALRHSVLGQWCSR